MKKIVIIIAAAGTGVAAAGIALPILINKWKTRGKSETKSSDTNQDVPTDNPDSGSTGSGESGEGGENLPTPTKPEENKPKVDVLCSSSTTEFRGHVYGCALANLTAEPIQVTVSPIVTKHESVSFTIPARRTYSFYSDTETFKMSVGDKFKCRVTKVVDKEYQYSGAEA